MLKQIKYMNKEVWMPIKGYESAYMVSNLGRVKSLYREIIRKNGAPIAIKERILSPGIMRKRGGYLCVSLVLSGKHKSFYIHRLVAAAFIPNPENKRTVNHIDGDVKNNNYKNLEWATDSENNKHAYKYLNRKPNWKGIIGFDNPFSRPIICLNNGKIFPGSRQASKMLNLHQSCISRVCNNKQPHHKGYVFKFL